VTLLPAFALALVFVVVVVVVVVNNDRVPVPANVKLLFDIHYLSSGA